MSEQDKQRRIAHLVALAHETVNHPTTAGPVWAKYPRAEAEKALRALWEAHLLLTADYLKAEGES